MNANLIFWCFALLDLGAVVTCIALGVARVRAGDIAAHRRSMLAAVTLVGVFLISYLVKLALLGREDRGGWTSGELTVLYVHELFVAAMLLGGGLVLKLRPPVAEKVSRHFPPRVPALIVVHAVPGPAATMAW